MDGQWASAGWRNGQWRAAATVLVAGPLEYGAVGVGQRSGRKKMHLCCQIANQGLRSMTEGDDVFRLLKDSDTLIILHRTKPVPDLTLLPSFDTADYANFQS